METTSTTLLIQLVILHAEIINNYTKVNVYRT